MFTRYFIFHFSHSHLIIVFSQVKEVEGEGVGVRLKRFFTSSLELLVGKRVLKHSFIITFTCISAALYAIRLADKDGFEKYSSQYNAGFLNSLFIFVDNYSPFHEVCIIIV